ncbi:hypothetical protein DES52_107183 [Deinococcus yavapaiensis KR-236]|uniref:Tetratricopeptide repeat protein n=2 Tax=Deinococcus TaxID=1298 RepID=A0A318S5T7_9DEIO|nr:hypothetical protein DES52_107183 [Deinococcus yavapaiensis KR-236]
MRAGLAVGLWGEPGVGKTHLAQSLLSTTPCPSLSVQASNALEQVALALPPLKRPGSWLARSIERLGSREALTGSQLVEVLAAQLAHGAPLIVHVEDLHAASPEQRQLWQQVAARVKRTKGAGLLVTSRTPLPEEFESIRVQPLSRAASDALLEAEVRAELPVEARAWIYEQAGGNPLFTLEFFRFLARQGLLWNDGRRWHWRVPEQRVVPATVEALIEEVIAGATESSSLKTVLQAKAILGRDVAASRLAEVVGSSLDELRDATEHLTRAGLLLHGEFVHPLYAEVMARGVPAQQRQFLGRRAIAAYQDDPQQAARFVKDAALEPGHALNLLKQAAQARGGTQANRWLVEAVDYASGSEQAALALEAATALKGSDLPTAIRLGELALELNPHDVPTIDLLAGIFASRKEQDKLDRVLAQLPESEHGERGLWRQIRLSSIVGDDEAVVDLVRQHPSLLGASPETCYDIAWSLLNVGRVEEAEQFARRAQQHPALTDRIRGALIYLQGIIHASGADNKNAEICFRQSLAIFRTLELTHNVVTGLHAHAVVLQDLGEYGESLAELQEAAALSLQRGHIVQFAEANLAIADHLVWQGEYEQAESLYLDSLGVLERRKPHGFLIDCLNALAELHLTLETALHVTLARKYASEALQVSKALNHSGGAASATRALAVTLLLDRQLSRAWERADEAMKMATSSGRPRQLRAAYQVKARIARALGHQDLARQSLEEAERLAAEIAEPLPLHVIQLERCALDRDLEGARTHAEWFEQRGLKHGVFLAHRYFPELAGGTTSGGAVPAASTAAFHIEVLGPMRLTVGPQTFPVRGRKRQELLATLLEARLSGRLEVARLSLTESLYADQTELQAGKLLADLVYQVREQLGAGLITTTVDGYALGAAVSSDAEVFLAHGDTRLWRGAAFSGLSLESRSEAAREALLLALQHRLEAQLTNDPAEVVRAAQLLLDADPYDLKALELSLRAQGILGKPKGQKRTYEWARSRLLEVGERLPETWADFLARSDAERTPT